MEQINKYLPECLSAVVMSHITSPHIVQYGKVNGLFDRGGDDPDFDTRFWEHTVAIRVIFLDCAEDDEDDTSDWDSEVDF